jgi:hypothetical protein
MWDQLPTAKSNHIAKPSCFQEWQVETSIKLPSGMTLQHLTQENWELSTLLSAASHDHAKTSALQEMEQAWKESEADYFSRSCAWPKKSSPNSYSLRTYQLLQLEGDFALLKKLPKWGIIVDGVLYPLQALEPDIKGNVGSYWLTPSTMEHLPVREGEALENALHRGKNRVSRRKVSGRLNEQVAYPTMWPTPTARDATRNKGGSPADCNRNTPNLPTASLKQDVGRLNPQSIGKRLCPRWVSVLMGYPTTWTDLEPWAMQWFLAKQKKRLKC